MSDIAAWVYVVGLVFFAAMTWIDNRTTHYTMSEPPSALLVGVFWPLVVLAALVWWVFSKEPT